MSFDIMSLVQKKPTHKLTRLEFLVLLSLRSRPLHGYGIMKKLTTKMPGVWKVKSGSLYPLLKRMVKKGLLEPKKKRTRTLYRLTPEGRGAVDEYLGAWKELYGIFKKMGKKS
ncbi:PadR family transcriptional regulator [archaeon]